MPALATPSYEPVSWERLPKARAPGAATATPAATAAAPSTSSLSFPVPAVDGEDDNEDVDEFNGFDTLSEYDAGVRSTRRTKRPSLHSCPRKPPPNDRLVISSSRRSKRRTPLSQHAFSMVNMNYARIRGRRGAGLLHVSGESVFLGFNKKGTRPSSHLVQQG
ncbi:uncharacterized protein LOC125520263 isoform X1 [Triticum urartu]|uniref:uncharacterized protein LOC125520263 isoform X1 n=1 Tax=Triticum urartu TaxID=4572 RepID=UPI002042FD4A|nr:uncharacterized protein LOC125520263 isoform X1 [Triticum urartu]